MGDERGAGGGKAGVTDEAGEHEERDYVDRGHLDSDMQDRPPRSSVYSRSLGQSWLGQYLSLRIHALADADTSAAGKNASFPFAGALWPWRGRRVRVEPVGEKISGTKEGRGTKIGSL